MTRAREELALDLPFHVNGTLDPEAAAEIAAWLATDPAARAEAEALAAIRADMQAEDLRSPGEFGLARLMRDIDREAAAAPAPRPAATAAPRVWLWKLAAAVALAAFLGQTWLGLGRDGGPLNMAGPRYGLAGGGDAPGAAAATAPRLVAAFAPAATEAEIRALLLEAGVEIVAGPSALGLYRLAADDPAAALAVLRGAAIVESVEHAND